MAAAIDVVFTGLMLICLDGSDCSGRYFPNTAWVVKADGSADDPRNVCGWSDSTETTLELLFDSRLLKLTTQAASPDCKPSADPDIMICPLDQETICLYPTPAPEEKRLEQSLQFLPRLDEVDQRFKAVLSQRLENTYYVPTRIHFPTGIIRAGERWPPEASPQLWSRSNSSASGALPRELSDRVLVTYDGADKLTFSDCGEKIWFELNVSDGVRSANATLRNRAKENLHPDVVGNFDNLAYLLWYYRLGMWSTTGGSCPEYSANKRDAVLLRCRRRAMSTFCACYSQNCERESVFWPPMLGPGFN